MSFYREVRQVLRELGSAWTGISLAEWVGMGLALGGILILTFGVAKVMIVVVGL